MLPQEGNGFKADAKGSGKKVKMDAKNWMSGIKLELYSEDSHQVWLLKSGSA